MDSGLSSMHKVEIVQEIEQGACSGLTITCWAFFRWKRTRCCLLTRRSSSLIVGSCLTSTCKFSRLGYDWDFCTLACCLERSRELTMQSLSASWITTWSPHNAPVSLCSCHRRFQTVACMLMMSDLHAFVEWEYNRLECVANLLFLRIAERSNKKLRVRSICVSDHDKYIRAPICYFILHICSTMQVISFCHHLIFWTRGGNITNRTTIGEAFSMYVVGEQTVCAREHNFEAALWCSGIKQKSLRCHSSTYKGQVPL